MKTRFETPNAKAGGPMLSVILAMTMAMATGQPESARAAQINFDDAPNGTIIDTRYPGVTFGCVACGSGHAYARDMAAFGSSAAGSEPNVVTLTPPFNAGDPNSSILTSFNAGLGAVTAVFAVPQRVVSIDARPQLPLEFLGTANNKPFLELYSSAVQNASTLIARVLYPLNFGDPGYCSPSVSACGGTWQTLSFTSTADNIVSIRISSQLSQPGPPVYADFDNLRFDTSASLARMSAEASFCTDFASGLPAGMRAFGGARVDAGQLKLITVPSDSFGIVYLDDFNNGAQVHGFRATFDATLFGSTCCAGGFLPADGFSFNLVPASNVLPNPSYGQPGEEGLDQGLAVNFDTWDNGNGEAPAIEVKWLGQIVASAPFQASQSPGGITDPVAARRAVVINLETDGTIDVAYGGVTVLSNVPTPYRPGTIGVPKWVLGARVGEANDNHWIDNLCITAYAGPRRCLDFNTSVPQDLRLFGGARADAGFLKLTTVVSNDAFGIAYVPDFGGGQLVKGFRATFKAALFGSTCCGGGGAAPADGFSFNLAPVRSVRSSPIYGEPGEEGLDEGLAVNFDTWDNGNGEAPAIEVKWLGQIVASAPFQASQSPVGAPDAATASRDVVIDLRTDGTMDVQYGGALVLNNVQTRYQPAMIGAPVWVLGARVGGANDNHWIDDLCIVAVPTSERPIPGLFSTGVNGNGQPIAENAVDPHYWLIPNGPSIFPTFPTYAATAAGGFPIPPWLPDNRSSTWISPAEDTVIRGGVSHVFETAFDLAGLNPATAKIFGRWSADNRGTAILLNGLASGSQTNLGFDVWNSFEISSGFVAGTNRLRFVIENDFDLSQLDGRNPGGLRVEVGGAANIDCSFNHPRPTLSIGRTAGGFEIRWMRSGWMLQSAGAPSGPWSNLTRGVSANGNDYVAALPTDSGNRFFRLVLDCQ